MKLTGSIVAALLAVRVGAVVPAGEQAIVRRVMEASAEIDAAQAKLTDCVSVLDYAGRVRRTNDVEVWSDAIAAALAEHEIVVLPGGRTYAIDRTIVMPSNRRLVAEGATVRLLAPAEVYVRTATDVDGTFAPAAKPRGDNISVVGGRWIDWCTSRRQGVASPLPLGQFRGMRAAIYLGNADHVAIEDVTIENAGGFGVQIDNADAVRLRGIRFARCRADGIHVDGNVSRIWICDVRGEVNDDFVAFNGYDWLLGSVNFGPQRDVLCEDIVPVDDIRRGYPSIRLLQGVFRYADGSKVDCRLSNAVFRNIRKVLTFKAYLHTQFFVIGEEPEFSEVGTIENIWFDDIEVDLIRPIDGRERCGLTAYSGSDPVRGHFAAFEFGTNADGVHFRNVRARLHPDRWPLSHFMTVGPKSATFRRAGDGKLVEVFDPGVTCRVRNVTLENVSIEGAPSASHFHETKFDNVNRDGRSSGRGYLEKPQTLAAGGGSESVTHSRARLGAIAERKAPNGDRMLYGLGYCLQVGPTTAAVLANRNVYSSQRGVWDFEDGVDVFLFDSLGDLATAKPIPVIRSGAEPDPDSDGRVRYHNRYPINGGFVPLGACVNGRPHPHAGTGFGVSTVLTYDLAPDGTFRQDRGNVKEYQIFYELKYDGKAFSARPVGRAFKGNRLRIGTTGWEFVASGLTAAIPDGEDLLAVVRARDAKAGPERPWTSRVGNGSACGVGRWRRIEGRWKPVDFTPVAFSDSAHNYYEPSLVRDAKGDLVFGVRDDGRPWQKVGWERGEQDLNAWKSSDGGRTWRQIVHVEKVRSNSPTSVGRTADGTVFIAGNHQKGYRRHLALWPVRGDGATLGEPVSVRNAETEFKPNAGQWLIDHPISAILRLRGGEIVSVLSYRARDDFWGKDRNHPVTVPSPEAGCYIETVSSSGKPVPVWEFL